MYYPKQIPYLLNETFKDNVDYKEYLFDELKEYCMCIWQMHSKQVLQQTIYNYILPDACIDLIINFTTKAIFFVGFSRDTQKLELNDKVDFIGVRMKPGAFYSLFHVSAEQIMDQVLPFSQIEKEKNVDCILQIKSATDRINILKEYLVGKIKKAGSFELIAFTDFLYQHPQDQSVHLLAHSFGYDKRQLYRVFKKHYGISPKVLLNILRLHLCLTLLFEDSKNPNDIIENCGFYDQSHFIKEVKRYTGISPFKLLESYQEQMSIFYNTKIGE